MMGGIQPMLSNTQHKVVVVSNVPRNQASAVGLRRFRGYPMASSRAALSAALRVSCRSHAVSRPVLQMGHRLVVRPVVAVDGMGAWGGRGRTMMMSTNNSEGQKPKEEPPKEGAKPEEQPTSEGQEKKAEEAPQEDPKQKQLDKLQAENKELRDRVIYTLAEMENVRAIAKKDADSSRQFAIQSFAKALLDVADNLTRAIDSVPKDLKKEDNGMVSTLLEGVQMTDAQLQKVFAANKISKFGAVGDKFDPHLHDALFEYEDAEKQPGTIGQVLKSGYKLWDRVIRPAQVGTVKKA